MKLKNTLLAATALSAVSALGVQADVITVATVNNGDMIRMQGLTDDFTAKTGHTVECREPTFRRFFRGGAPCPPRVRFSMICNGLDLISHHF